MRIPKVPLQIKHKASSKKAFPGILFGLMFVLTACAFPRNGRIVLPFRLARFSQNNVSVDITLSQDSDQNNSLSASFTPKKGYHLYSKDIPRNGILGEGRSTLLELAPQSQMRSIGKFTANLNDEISNMGMDTLLVYPAGPVILQLQVTLPPGTGWYDEQ